MAFAAGCATVPQPVLFEDYIDESTTTGVIKALRNGFRLLFRPADDDIFDRLSSRYSTAICLVFAFIISTGQYVGDPIDCFTPAEFNGQWIRYTDRYCWISNTYYVPKDEMLISSNIESGYYREISYYQWTSLILILQAFFFALPGVIWNFTSVYSGYNIDKAVQLCNAFESTNPEHRDIIIKYFINQVDRTLGYRREYRNGCMAHFRIKLTAYGCSIGKRYGVQFILSYLCIKLLYIGSAVSQLFMLNAIIGEGYTLYGWTVLKRAIQGEDLPESKFFPRVTFCNVDMRRMGHHVNTYTVQCVLPINVFNEKIYLFLWWWLLILCGLSLYGLLCWSPALIPICNRKFVKKYLKVMGRNTPRDKELHWIFTLQYLRLDGIFMLRLLSKNVTDLTMGEIVTALYDNFKVNRANLLEAVAISQRNAKPPARKKPRCNGKGNIKRRPLVYISSNDSNANVESLPV